MRFQPSDLRDPPGIQLPDCLSKFLRAPVIRQEHDRRELSPISIQAHEPFTKRRHTQGSLLLDGTFPHRRRQHTLTALPQSLRTQFPFSLHSLLPISLIGHSRDPSVLCKDHRFHPGRAQVDPDKIHAAQHLLHDSYLTMYGRSRQVKHGCLARRFAEMDPEKICPANTLGYKPDLH